MSAPTVRWMDGELVPRVESPGATGDGAPVDKESADGQDSGELRVLSTDLFDQIDDADAVAENYPTEFLTSDGFARCGEQ